MAHTTKLALLASLLSSLAIANPIISRTSSETVHPTNGICTDYTVSQTITSQNLVFALDEFQDNFDVAAILFNITQGFRETPEQGSIDFMPFLPQPQNVTATYELAGTFCRPESEKEGKEKTVLIATHGLGYDRRYWASSYQPEKYNFVQSMLDSGYSVFYYDRLGTGESQKISGYENQASIQIELLRQLAIAIRDGSYTDTIKADKIVLVGHSFGSSLSASVVAAQPDIVECLIVTGYSFPAQNDTLSLRAQPFIPSIFANRIATPNYPDRDSGYLAFGDIYAHVETFLHQPDYDTAAAEYAQSISQPGAISEFLTLSLNVIGNSAEFKGRLLTTSGKFDLIVCSGNCEYAYAAEAWKDIYTNAAETVGYVHPDAGHGQNFHLNTQDLYGEIVNFLDGGF